MSIIDTIKGWIVRKAAAFGMIPMWEQGKPQYTPHNYENFAKEGYRKNEVIYSCIREIATSASEPKAIAYRQRNGEKEELPLNHPLAILLARPNPHMTQAQMISMWATSLNIAGNAYLAKLRTNAGGIGELWHLRPDRVKVIPDRQSYVSGYQYEVSTIKKILDADDVIHDKWYDPNNDYYGLSPIAIASRLGDVDNEGTDFVKRFFEGGVQVPFWLVHKGRLPPQEKERVRRQYRKMYGGHKKWIEPGILDADVDILRTGLDFQQMDFKFLRSMSESRICSIFGVPPILVGAEIGLERSTYSNYEEAKRSFWDETMMPLFRQIEDKLNMGLAPEFGEGLVIEFDFSTVRALQENVNEIWARATAAFQAAAITRNMFLEEIGKDPVDGGDIFLQPMMLLPVSAGEKPEPPPEAEKQLKAQSVYEQKASRFARAVDLTARAWEGRFRDEARKLFVREREDILKLLRKEGKAAKQGAPFQSFLIAVENYYNKAGDNWRKAFLPVFEALLISQGDNLAAAFGISFDVTRPEVADFLNGYTMQFAEGIIGTSGKEVKDVILKAQQEGWSVPQIRQALTDEFEQFDRVRAENIARYETLNSSNAGALEAYRQAGVEEQEWWDGQEGACDWCQALHKEVISVREVFFSKGDTFDITDADGNVQTMKITYTDIGHPPLHGRCRCTTIPVVEV